MKDFKKKIGFNKTNRKPLRGGKLTANERENGGGGGGVGGGERDRDRDRQTETEVNRHRQTGVLPNTRGAIRNIHSIRRKNWDRCLSSYLLIAHGCQSRTCTISKSIQ